MSIYPTCATWKLKLTANFARLHGHIRYPSEGCGHARLRDNCIPLVRTARVQVVHPTLPLCEGCGHTRLSRDYTRAGTHLHPRIVAKMRKCMWQWRGTNVMRPIGIYRPHGIYRAR